MNKFKNFSVGLLCILNVEMAHAELTKLEQNKTMASITDPIVEERDIAIQEAVQISKNMLAKSELQHIKIIAKADKDKVISDANAIKLKELAKVEAIKRAAIVKANEKAEKEIYEINKEVESIKVNAIYLYNQKIKKAEKKLNSTLVKDKKNTNNNIAMLLKDNKIKFGVGTQNLTKNSIIQIKKIASLLKGKNKKIRVAGYTDSDGSSVLNKKLSLDRANKVKKVLIAEGLNPKNIIGIGYGELHPLVPNTSSRNKEKNRRIVISIIK